MFVFYEDCEIQKPKLRHSCHLYYDILLAGVSSQQLSISVSRKFYRCARIYIQIPKQKMAVLQSTIFSTCKNVPQIAIPSPGGSIFIRTS